MTGREPDAAGAVPGARTSVLLYHQLGRASDPVPNPDCFCSVDRFRAHLDHLAASSVAVLGLREACDGLFGGTLRGPSVAITFDDAFLSFPDLALPLLRAAGMPATLFAASGWLGRMSGWIGDPAARRPVVDAARLRWIAGHGIEIGAHSVHHRRLTEIGHAEALSEIHDSKACLEDMLGQEVCLFAYPHGLYDRSIAGLVRDAGYRYAVTCRAAFLDRAPGPFEIPRRYVTALDDVNRFAAKLAGGARS